VVGGEDDERRVRIPITNAVRGEEHGGAGSAILRLQEHVRRRSIGKLAGDVRGVLGPRDDDGALGRNDASHPVQRLAKERVGTQQWNVLLGALVSEELADERSQSDAVPTGEDDRPGLRRPKVEGVRARRGLEG
jgi:hypothetical protein